MRQEATFETRARAYHVRTAEEAAVCRRAHERLVEQQRREREEQGPQWWTLVGVGLVFAFACACVLYLPALVEALSR